MSNARTPSHRAGNRPVWLSPRRLLCNASLLLAAWIMLSVDTAAQPDSPSDRVPAARQSTASPATARLLLADGTRHQGPVTRWSTTEITLGQTTVPVREVVHLRFANTAPTRARKTAELMLANGDHVAARVLEINEESLTAEWELSGLRQKMQLPLETVTGFTALLPRGDFRRLKFLRQMSEPSDHAADYLFLRNDDTVAGELTGFDGRRYLLRNPTTATETSIDSAGVRAVRLNPDLVSFPDSNGPLWLITLADGSCVTAQSIAWNGPHADRPQSPTAGILRLHLACGATIRVSQSALVSATVLGGRAVYLSDLKPVAYRFRPFLSQNWPLREDRNVIGGPLRLRGRTYAKGLGTHSRSEITYELDRKYERFQTVLGIDDCSNGAGQVVFSVLLDGQRVFQSPMLSGTDAAHPLPAVDVSRGNRLTLIVDYGAGGDVLDRADWCDALLIRKADSPR